MKAYIVNLLAMLAVAPAALALPTDAANGAASDVNAAPPLVRAGILSCHGYLMFKSDANYIHSPSPA